MVKLNIGGEEFKVKFGYLPTIKEHLISRMLQMTKKMEKEDGEISLSSMEDMLAFLPEFLLIGLQVCHEEYRYDYNTGEGKAEKLEMAFNLLDKYFTEEDGEIMELFSSLQNELSNDSFLKSLYKKGKEETEKDEEEAVKKEDESGN